MVDGEQKSNQQKMLGYISFSANVNCVKSEPYGGDLRSIERIRIGNTIELYNLFKNNVDAKFMKFNKKERSIRRKADKIIFNLKCISRVINFIVVHIR